MQWSMENANVQTRKKERMLPPYCARRFLQDLKLVASLCSMLRQMQGLSFAPLQFEITDHRESKRVFDVCVPVLVCFWLVAGSGIDLVVSSLDTIDRDEQDALVCALFCDFANGISWSCFEFA